MDWPRLKACLRNERAEHLHARPGHHQEIHHAVRRKSGMGLFERQYDVAVAGAGVPGTIVQIDRLLRKERRFDKMTSKPSARCADAVQLRTLSTHRAALIWPFEYGPYRAVSQA